jgi:peptidoglycan/LPS O-acetylase OafA/YrhL
LYVANVDRLPWVTPFLRVLIGVAFGLVVLGLWRTTSKPVIRLFSFAPFAYLGKISYGLYVYHLFSFHFADRLQSLPVPGFGLIRYLHPAVPAFLLTVALAALSWHLYESPINYLKRFFPYRRRTIATPTQQPVPSIPLVPSQSSAPDAIAGPAAEKTMA